MPTSAEIRPSSQVRKDFLDFFKSKQHTIVPSSSLMPDAPNLLFTNAGMNQFVPIFLGQAKCPYTPGRAADTQKCIRAGGKHNDLDDVGLDTYHHTFFEMLGNWSFGDYFKKEAIEWAWELVVEKWRFTADRLYATVFCPHMNMTRWADELANVVELARLTPDGQDMPYTPVSDPGAAALEWSDKEAAFHWAKHFLKAGQVPLTHIIPGNKKDNFWMMGDTGPCGPCSELHVDLTPAGDTKGSLVNKGDARCIEIWNLVFIQFNANPDGTFTPLPARHVDTGMGFERVTSIIQGTKGFKDFADAKISNYETDIFRPIFDELEKLSRKKYSSTVPEHGFDFLPEPVKTDIAFRVIADHIRALSFAVADGIEPGNTDRNYVLRRILRRAVSYSRNINLREPFLYKLVGVLADTMGDIFPNIREKRSRVEAVIRREEESFNLTLDNGLELFNFISGGNNLVLLVFTAFFPNDGNRGYNVSEIAALRRGSKYFDERALALLSHVAPLSPQDLEVLRTQPGRLEQALVDVRENPKLKEKAITFLRVFPPDKAFDLYHTYGFPIDLTEVKLRERGLTVDPSVVERLIGSGHVPTVLPVDPAMDSAEVERLMELERERSRAAQKKTVIEMAESIGGFGPTQFVGYDTLEFETEFGGHRGSSYFVTVSTPFYAEMGGQVGDSGWLETSNEKGDKRAFRIVNTTKTPNGVYLHMVDPAEKSMVLPPIEKDKRHRVVLRVDRTRRNAIQRHHTVTHLFHWALHEVVSKDATQKGSYVGPEKLTFDFNSAPLTAQQIADIEKLVNERILENAGVGWIEVPYADVKSRKDVLQFFGDKYGETVRVVQVGGTPGALNGYSMELCGGTHTRATGEIGLFRIAGESAIAAGVRRIEAVAGLEAYRKTTDELHLIKTLAGKVNSPVGELEKKIEALLAHQKELEKQVKIALQRNASNAASELLGRAQTVNGIPLITHNLGDADGDFLQAIADALKGRFKGVVVLGGVANNAVTLVASVSPEFAAEVQAGKIIQQIAPIVGGKGGGKPDNARGGGKDATKLDEALAKAKTLIAS